MTDVPLLPPPWFVERYNIANPDQPFRTALDPLLMLAWHMANDVPDQPAILITGC